ncbi:zinc metallopeptidase [Campylobacter sp. JMF_01 NE2]|uniref:KPN_02809 family neutral zinc metallopeptidase n=1 Tax=unclassified Campylobacter TaxID=2593542 RepID=UPI0022E9FB70|nr:MULTISPECIES: neutral zinc metallopeptidase [unclassified Campylobacter]MDA3051920.1 zinc metallopeptidase [Campylobacter sp. JMF_03 NE3]MDA3066254.1 zinc metallopeptidase [Campylobacter sp. JMF_01 NE2]MDA3078068.1 zinc metallopeptidase [Campylobacter sp. JMF_06 NA1]
MKWRGGNKSSNIDDMRASSGGGGGGVNLALLIPVVKFLVKTKFGRIVLALGVVAAFMGYNPLNLLNFTSAGGGAAASKFENNEAAQEAKDFVSTVLRQTEDVWGTIFAKYGAKYSEPRLLLFHGATRSGCGYASSQVGPFYCPADTRIYLDTDFFSDLAKKHHAAGDFAQGYVIAHEVGHHVQNLLGILSNADKLKARTNEAGANAIQVRVELQADCLAGIWGHHQYKILEDGDLEEALNAATMIGDDTLQKKARGYVVPDSFTHGSGAQRKEWFYKGFKSGSLEACKSGLES